MATCAAILNSVTAACVAVLAASLWALKECHCGCVLTGLLALASLLSAAVAAAAQWIRSQRPCDSLPLTSLASLALRAFALATVGRVSLLMLRRNLRSSAAVAATQEKVLLALMRRNEGCRFGRDHDFKNVTSVADYRSRVPVRQYQEMQKYYDMAYRGESDAVFSGPVQFLAKTSGTTGKNKHFPQSSQGMRDALPTFLAVLWCNELYKRKCGRPGSLARILCVKVYPPDRKNEFGVPVGPLSKFWHDKADIYTLPPEAFASVHDTDACMYLHAVFALYHENIDFVDAFFPSVLTTFLRQVERNFDSVVNDIAAGRLSDTAVQLDAELRRKLNSRLSPKPQRAADLRRVFADGSDFSDFFRKAWPNLSYVSLARGGAFGAAYRRLRAQHLGNVPTSAMFFGGSEGLVGVNASMSGSDNSDYDLYHPVLGVSFVEFLPLDAGGADAGDPVLVQEMRPGVNYETVITSNCCYRLRTGDVMAVKQFDGVLPVLALVHRKSATLSVHVEKTPESSLQAAVRAFADKSGRLVADCCACDSFLYEAAAGSRSGSNGKYYVVFAEAADTEQRPFSDKEVAQLDASLMEVDENYRLFRSEGHIDPLLLLQVRPGGFLEFKAAAMQRNHDISEAQFKMPSVLTNDNQLRDMLQLLL